MAARLLGSSNRYREIINLNTRAYPASDGNPATTAILGPNYWLMMGKYYRIPLSKGEEMIQKLQNFAAKITEALANGWQQLPTWAQKALRDGLRLSLS